MDEDYLKRNIRRRREQQENSNRLLLFIAIIAIAVLAAIWMMLTSAPPARGEGLEQQASAVTTAENTAVEPLLTVEQLMAMCYGPGCQDPNQYVKYGEDIVFLGWGVQTFHLGNGVVVNNSDGTTIRYQVHWYILSGRYGLREGVGGNNHVDVLWGKFHLVPS